MQTDRTDIGRFLKSTREDLDLSQVEVMKRTGINNKTLSGYENNVAEPDLRTLASLANLYGFSIDGLLNVNSKCDLTANEDLLLRYYRRLSKKDKKQLIMQIKASSENK